MKNILNPLDESLGLSGSTCGDNEVTRYTIYPKKGFVTASTFKNFRNDTFERYINRFDFPTINEAYRGREVSFSLNTEMCKIKWFLVLP